MKENSKKMLRYWKPIMKEDRWWDYIFFMKIIKHKLNHMIINWDKSHYVDSKKDKKVMKKVIKCIDKFIEDNFEDKYINEVDKKYGKRKTKIKNGIIQAYRKGKYESEEARYELLKAIKKGEKDKQKCKEYIFNTIRDNIEKWWD